MEIEEKSAKDANVSGIVEEVKEINNKAIIYKNYFTSYQFDLHLKQGFIPHSSRERFLQYQIQRFR